MSTCHLSSTSVPLTLQKVNALKFSVYDAEVDKISVCVTEVMCGEIQCLRLDIEFHHLIPGSASWC